MVSVNSSPRRLGAPPPAESLDPAERMSRDALSALQLERLKSTLRHAYRGNPRHRARFEAAGVHPDDLRGLDDLARFPFTTKDELRAGYPFDGFCVPREQVARIHASSGTTGQPTVVGYTRKDLETWADICARSLRAAGGRPGDLIHVVYGYGLFTGGLGVHYGAERLGMTVVPMSGGMTPRQVNLIDDFAPRVIAVTPSYLLSIVEEFRSSGRDPSSCSLEVAVLGAEPWTEQMRTQIEGALDLDAVDIYGLSEVMGPGVAMECTETKDGLHVWEDHFYPEIIDPDTGRPLPDGEEGELVFTSLTKEAFPVIRYRTRDIARLLPGTARPMRRIGRIEARSDDMIVLRGVNVFPSQIEEQVLRIDGLAPHYQLQRYSEARGDGLRVQVEARPEASEIHARDVLAAHLAQAIKGTVGVRVEVVVGAPGTVPRSQGKAPRVLDLRDRG